MIDHFSTVKENGREFAEQKARELEKQGYEILEITEEMVPRGENADGKTYYVPGYRITVDDGRPPLYKGYIFDYKGYRGYGCDERPMAVNENLQDPPGMKSKPAWLWE